MKYTLRLFFKIDPISLNEINTFDHLKPSNKEGIMWDNNTPFLIFDTDVDKYQVLKTNPCVDIIHEDLGFKMSDNIEETGDDLLDSLFTNFRKSPPKPGYFNRYELNCIVIDGYFKNYPLGSRKVIIMSDTDSHPRFVTFTKIGNDSDSVYISKCYNNVGCIKASYFDEVIFPEINSILPNSFKELSEILIKYGIEPSRRFK